MSVIFSENLVDFLDNKSLNSSWSLQFKSGIIYEGSLKDNQACGFGKFFCTVNEFFEGFFSKGIRVKVGHQQWSDGDSYKGEFYNDKRHGWGIYRWWNGDIYCGSFYDDMRHGYGTYTSNDGDMYTGTFYKNRREGFGTLRYKCGNVFQGLYKENYRCGPGVLIYQDGRKDIGLWHRGSLLKLIINIDEVFRVSQFSDLMEKYPSSNSAAMSKEPTSGCLETDEHNYELDEILTYKITMPKSINIFKEDLDSDADVNVKENIAFEKSLEIDSQVNLTKEIDEQNPHECDRLDSVESEPLQSPITIESINSEEIVDPHSLDHRREPIEVDKSFQEFLANLTTFHTSTPLMLKVLDHLRHFSPNIPVTCDLADPSIDITTVTKDVVTNIFDKSSSKIDRYKKYGIAGDMETKSRLLITSSHVGNLNEVKTLFSNSIPPNPNVTDGRGSFSLLEATLTFDIDLINYILDCGADINQITDEGISALGSCFLFYYPEKGFIETIAESVVSLSYTPTNFNGIRREPVKNPNQQNDLSDPLQPNADNAKFNNIDATTENPVERWDDYQLPMLSSNLPANQSKWKEESTGDFDSYRNAIEYPTKVTSKLIEKAASVLSNNSVMIQRQQRPNSRNQELSSEEGTTRFKALQIARHNQMLQVILLLLRRGADPNVCKIPFPAIFFAVKSADVEMTKLLISKGANVNARLGVQNGYLTPLHIASCLSGKQGIIITELLLRNNADPNARASEDESFLDKSMMDEWSKDVLTDEQLSLIGGKTPLHLASSRYDDFKVSYQIVQLLLDYGGDPNIICNGHSSLTLAIASGNDMIVDKLIANTRTNVNLQLTHGLGNALCVACSTSFEHTRTVEARIVLIKKLISAGADLMNSVAIGQKRLLGSAVDYAYNVFFLDQRVSKLPYHALTSVERDLFNNRKNILSFMGMFTRECAVEKEKKRLEAMKIDGMQSRGPSPDFVWTGAGADLDSQKPISKALSKLSQNLTNLDIQMQGSDLLARMTLDACNRSGKMVLFRAPAALHKILKQSKLIESIIQIRKPLFKYCYDCGRSINVKLTACTRCKEVFFCSKLCKTKAWNNRHKSECLRVGGRLSTSGNDQKNNRNIDSPTPATILEDPTLSKETINMGKFESLKQKKIQIGEKDDMNSGTKGTQPPRKLPPLESRNHPSYSYTYTMGDYVKFDDAGKIIILDNYSFV